MGSFDNNYYNLSYFFSFDGYSSGGKVPESLKEVVLTSGTDLNVTFENCSKEILI